MKHWSYAWSNQRVGLMVCTACHKPITEADGDFRYRETDDAYLPQHRACSQDDPEWVRIDQRRAAHVAFYARRKAALQAFINLYGAPDDDEIDECIAARGVSVPSTEFKSGDQRS